MGGYRFIEPAEMREGQTPVALDFRACRREGGGEREKRFGFVKSVGLNEQVCEIIACGDVFGLDGENLAVDGFGLGKTAGGPVSHGHLHRMFNGDLCHDFSRPAISRTELSQSPMEDWRNK